MPARKSDQRKSDVTAARFALVDDLPQTQQNPDAAPASAPAASAQPAPPASSTADEAQSHTPAAEKKDREKDKEKDKDKDKDKEKDKDHKDAVTIEDLTLPKSIITRLAKGVLPPNTQIQANAILAISKSATVFISYLAAHANENTVNANKKTIAPADVFKALDEVELSFLREPLEAEFAKFSAMQAEKRTSYRQKVRATKPSGNPGDDTDMADSTLGDTTTVTAAAGPTSSSADASAPRAKKQRVDAAAAAGAAADGEVDDAETEDDDVHEDDEDAPEEEEDEEQEEQGSGDETQDALEERDAGEERDEALDGDESD